MPRGMRKELGLMMCDILPTGYSVAMNAFRLADEDRGVVGGGKAGNRGVCVVIGCGPASPSLHSISHQADVSAGWVMRYYLGEHDL